MADDFGTIYGMKPTGELVRHKHLGAADGTFNWLGGNTVGVGWQSLRHLYSDGSDGPKLRLVARADDHGVHGRLVQRPASAST